MPDCAFVRTFELTSMYRMKSVASPHLDRACVHHVLIHRFQTGVFQNKRPSSPHFDRACVHHELISSCDTGMHQAIRVARHDSSRTLADPLRPTGICPRGCGKMVSPTSQPALFFPEM